MIKLLKHHRIQIPNTLAIVAAFVLVVSSIVGFDARQEVYSQVQEPGHSVQVDNIKSNSISNAAENKSRRINIGSLLFRRK